MIAVLGERIKESVPKRDNLLIPVLPHWAIRKSMTRSTI